MKRQRPRGSGNRRERTRVSTPSAPHIAPQIPTAPLVADTPQPRPTQKAATPPAAATAPAAQHLLLSDAAPVVIAASLCGFAFLFLIGQSVREARLQLPPLASEGLLFAAIGLGFAASLYTHRRTAENGGSRCAFLSPEMTFAAAALLAAIPCLLVAWSTAGLERFRELLAVRSIAPPVVLRCALALPLLAGALFAAFSVVRAVLALHHWHRCILHQRLRAVVLWIALVTSAGLGGGVALVVRDANRYWPVSALLLFAAAAIAALNRSHADQVAATSAARWPQTIRKSWLITSLLLAAMSAAATLPQPDTSDFPAFGQPLAFVVLMLGGSGAFLLVRLASRLHIGIDYVPLAIPLVAFVQSAVPASALRAVIAAILLLAGFALLVQHAARAAHSIPFSLSTVGAAGSLGFALIALSLAFISDDLALRWTRFGLAAACVIAAGLLVWRSTSRGAACSACVTACMLWLLVGPLLPARPSQTRLTPVASDEFRDEIRLRLVDQLHGKTSIAADADAFSDLDSISGDCLIIAASSHCSESADALRAGRYLRRMSRAANAGGRLIFEEPLDGLLAATLDRYAKRARPAFGPVYDLRIRGPASEYRAAIIGPDVEPWLAERAWPHGYQVQLQAR